MKINVKLFCLIAGAGWVICFCGACNLSDPLQAKMLSLTQPTISSTQLRQRADDLLFETMAGSDPVLQCHALETLALLEADPSIATQIRIGLNHPSMAVRFAGAISAGDIAEYSSKPLLEHMLHDSNPSLKMASAYALEKMGDRRFFTWYNDILESKDAQLCSQACMLLGKLGKTSIRRDSVEKLRQVLHKKDQAPAVKLQAAESLARLGDEKILNNLLVFSNSGYASDRLLAIAGLEWLKDQTAQTMLMVLADDEHLEVSLAGIRTLGPLADASHLQVVRENLHYQDPENDQDAEQRIRGLALLALGKVGKQSDAHHLYKAMSAQSGYTRIAAARAAIDLLDRFPDFMP
jgi:HEAT repeat protein